jgi:hypothetical protein
LNVKKSESKLTIVVETVGDEALLDVIFNDEVSVVDFGTPRHC